MKISDTMTGELDLVVLEAARGGDVDAMTILLTEVQPMVRRYAMKHCVISDVDDAVQEVLIVVARRLESLRIMAAFSSWIFKTVQRECRRLGRVALNYDPFDEGELEAWLNSYSDDELLFELVDGICKLPDEDREVIFLKDFMQFTSKEIAQEFDISVAAVKSRLHRARLKLRDSLMGET